MRHCITHWEVHPLLKKFRSDLCSPVQFECLAPLNLSVLWSHIVLNPLQLFSDDANIGWLAARRLPSGLGPSKHSPFHFLWRQTLLDSAEPCRYSMFPILRVTVVLIRRYRLVDKSMMCFCLFGFFCFVSLTESRGTWAVVALNYIEEKKIFFATFQNWSSGFDYQLCYNEFQPIFVLES